MWMAGITCARFRDDPDGQDRIVVDQRFGLAPVPRLRKPIISRIHQPFHLSQLPPASPPERKESESAGTQRASMFDPHGDARAAEQHAMPKSRPGIPQPPAAAVDERQPLGVKACVLYLVPQELVADPAQEFRAAR